VLSALPFPPADPSPLSGECLWCGGEASCSPVSRDVAGEVDLFILMAFVGVAKIAVVVIDDGEGWKGGER
jgi:hypothetical protein